jgi:two-component system, OmpR family, response regulator RegX3
MSASDPTGAVRVVVVCDVDDECRLREVFGEEGWEVTVVHVAEAIEHATHRDPDLVVLHDLPIHQATMTCTTLHRDGPRPTIAMSSTLREQDVVAGLHSGIDTFVPEAVGERELVARARALLRRYVRPRPATDDARDVLVVEPVALDRGSRLVTVGGEHVPMPRREFDILELLMRDAPRTVPRTVLVRELWVAAPDSQTLEVQVRRLRSRLAAAAGGARLITTVRGVGYRFVTPDDEPDHIIDLTAVAGSGRDEDREIDLTQVGSRGTGGDGALGSAGSAR